MKELVDRVVITWDLTEPFGNIQDFTWVKTTNRFQTVLHSNGLIEMSYDQLAAKDAIIGIYPMLPDGMEKPLANIVGEPHLSLTAHLDVRNVKFSLVDGILLKVTFETRGPVPPESDAAAGGVGYRLFFNPPQVAGGEAGHETVVWTVRGFAPPGRPTRYVGFGPGVSRRVQVRGNTITIQGILPAALRGAGQVAVHAEVIGPGDSEQIVEKLPPHNLSLSGIRSPEVHLSSLTRKEGPFAVALRIFSLSGFTTRQDLACTVIKALGDKFDFLAYYSDFRIDNQEAGTPSDGPRGRRCDRDR